MKLMRFLPALIVMILIFCFSAQNSDSSSALSDSVVEAAYGSESVGELTPTLIVRKTAHFMEYAILGGALCFGITGYVKKKGMAVLLSSLAGAAYAVTDEIHQYFVPGRACMASDVLIDSAGVFAGAAALCLLYIVNDKLKVHFSKK